MITHIDPPPLIEEPNVWIPGADGTRLAARIWRPTDEVPVPAILEYLPYRKRDGTVARDTITHPRLVGHGYASVRVDIRGSGESDGVLTDEYLPSELDDGVAIIDWIAAQPWCDGNVGMVGISWGGFNGLQIAALQPSALKAIITLCSTDDRYADDIHRMGGCVLADELSWASVMFAYNSLPPDPDLVGDRWLTMWDERLEGSGLWLAEWLRHQRRDGFFRHGSVCEDYGAIRCPVYAVSGWADGYSNAVFRLLEHLDVPRKGLIGPWVHAYPHLARPGPAIDFVGEMVRWWDHWLKGRDTGIMDEPMLRTWMQDPIPPAPAYEDRPGRWVADPGWPSPTVRRTEWLLDAVNGTLGVDAAGEVEVATPLWVGRNAGKWCAYGHGPDLPSDQRWDDAGSVVFDSAPLTDPIEVLGAPVAELTVSVDRPVAQLAVRLCAVDPSGASSRVSFGVLNLTHRDSHGEPVPLEAGRRYTVRLQLNDAGQRFDPGQRIRLAVSSSYWPMIWPSPESATIRLHCEESRLLLPERTEVTPARLRPLGDPVGATPAPRTVLRPPVGAVSHHHEVGVERHVVEVVDDSGRVRLDDIGVLTDSRTVERYTIVDGDPTSAVGEVETVSTVARDGWTVVTTTTTRLSVTAEDFVLDAELVACLDGVEIRTRAWHETIPRDLV